MMKSLALTVVLLTCLSCGSAGCGSSPITPTTWQESWVLDETPRVAALLGVKVRGELTDKDYILRNDGVSTRAVGWYTRGVAYYYRPWVNQQESPRVLTSLVIHEVCHALWYDHGDKWRKCADLDLYK